MSTDDAQNLCLIVLGCAVIILSAALMGVITVLRRIADDRVRDGESPSVHRSRPKEGDSSLSI